MEITFVKQIPEDCYDELLALFALCDDDFLPPLSARTGTTQKNFTAGGGTAEEPVAYCREIMAQKGFLVTENGRLAALLSFRENYTCSVISADTFPNTYISTIVVHPNYRGKGLGSKLYHALMEAYSDHQIFTRTWSTNASQLRILPKMQFHEFARIQNDRGAGIDTVYFCRSAQQKGMEQK
ncbi:MAG: GNAT family N-acetyltransferase [Clostridia bacterium]